MVPFRFCRTLVILATLCPKSLEIECFHARSALPNISHCQELTNAIAWLSRMPGENNVRAWGRRLPTTAETQELPKVYFIDGPAISTTCTVKVDVDRTDSFAVDSFRLSDVAAASARVVDECLVGQRLIGLDYPSEAGHVYVKIIRTDAPAELELPRKLEIQNLSLPNSASVLHIISGKIMVKQKGTPRANGSLGQIDDE